jgi:RND superfamily putative drug exporter
MLTRWTRSLLRHRGIVIIVWVLLAVLGLMVNGALNARLSTSLSVPGSESAQANVILATHFHENVEGSFSIVVVADGQGITSIERRVTDAVRTIPTGQILQAKELSGVLYIEADTNLNLAHAADATGRLRHALAQDGLDRALVTGPAALQSDITPVLKGDLRRGELIALLVALVLLIALLGLCGVVAVPFVVAGATISTSLVVVYLLAHVVLMVLYVPNVIGLIGLGLAIDYSLLIVHRFRFEMTRATSTADAVVATVLRAGRTVVISGLAVSVGLATLLLVPVPFLRSLGAAGIVVPLVSMAAALTLQPVLLSLLGARGLRTLGVPGLMGERDRLAVGWSKTTHLVLRRPRTMLVLSLAAVALCGSSLWWLQLTPGSLSAIPATLPSAAANTFMNKHVGPGVITPDQVVLVAPAGENWRSTALQRVETRLGTIILAEPEVVGVVIGVKAPYVDATGRYAQLFVIGGHQFGAEASQALVARIRDLDVPAADLPRGVQVYVGGAPAQGVDFLNRVYGSFPWIVALAMASALVILWRAFRSLALAVLAIVLDLLSVVAAYGAMVAVFRFGVGESWLGTYRVDQIEGWVPVFVFAMLFGLSMDYEVFIVARMREARDTGLSWDAAIESGLANTGGVVSAAALIMVGALSGLVLGHIAGLQELGVGLAAGVLVDASLVRGLVLPACLTLMGDRALR